ncbi:MAG: clostripain-related cysteine peptidase [Caldilineaceae bacterium]
MVPAKAEWTVMVFLNADNNLEPFSLRDFAEMAKVGSSDKVNIILQYDRNYRYDEHPQPKSECFRYRVTKGMEPLATNALPPPLGNTNMGDGKVLGDFVAWAMKTYPAKRYMLDIWDHGQGWRMREVRTVVGSEEEVTAYRDFRRDAMLVHETRSADGSDVEEVMPAFSSMEGIAPDQVLESVVRYCSVDETSKDKLFNREIQDSLMKVLHAQKLDLVGFDCCLMSMVETAYAMRNVAKVMVGSEELEPGNGWNYADWLDQLVAKPTMTAVQLGKVLVDSYRKTYQAVAPDTTMSAVDLARLPDVALAVDKLAQVLCAKLPTELADIKKARNNCKTFAPGFGLHGIDLMHFSQELAGTAHDAAIKNEAMSVFKATKASVLANYVGSARLDGFGAQGLAIYFPAGRALFKTDPDGQGYVKTNTTYPVEFVQTQHWADFLAEYYQRVP